MTKVSRKDDIEEEGTSSERICKHYMSQCMTIKKEIFDILASLHRDMGTRTESYMNKALTIKQELDGSVTEAEKLKDSIEGEAEKIKKSLKAEIGSLNAQRLVEKKEIDQVLERMKELESYIKNERFHDLVKEINQLEDEFEQKAVQLAQSRMRKKDK